jgi:hypothetical protein
VANSVILCPLAAEIGILKILPVYSESIGKFGIEFVIATKSL